MTVTTTETASLHHLAERRVGQWLPVSTPMAATCACVMQVTRETEETAKVGIYS